MGPLRGLGRQRGITLPFVTLMIVVVVIASSATAFLVTHFKTIAVAEDEERVYYALDAGVEAVMADLVRGADALDSSYVPPTVTVNGITPSITISAPGPVATPTVTQQYWDPGRTSPELLNLVGGESYVFHIHDIFPSQGGVTSLFDVNWSFNLSGSNPVANGLRVRLMQGEDSLTPGRNSGCPGTGSTILSNKNREFAPAGDHHPRHEPVELTASGIYTVAFCISELSGGTLTTNAFKPTGATPDTWVYSIGFRDYKITASAEGAEVTAYVRQVPGVTEPPSGDWSDTNISWVVNLVTPYQWER